MTRVLSYLNKQLISELLRFGIVGCSAAAVNIILVILIVEYLHWDPLLANIVGFGLAFFVSFFGHHYWSFGHLNKPVKHALPKFLLVALSGFAGTEFLYYIFYKIMLLHYVTALVLVLFIIPPVSFLISKLWAFREHEEDRVVRR